MAKENKYSKALKQAKKLEEEETAKRLDEVMKEFEEEANRLKEEEAKRLEMAEVYFTNLFEKKKKKEKILVNFTLEEDTYKGLITLAEKNNLTLTEVVQTTLDTMLKANKVKISEKAVESFKAKNERRGRPRKESK